MRFLIPQVSSLIGVLVLAACTSEKQETSAKTPAADEFQKALQTQLITAKPGDVIAIPAGRHAINRGLSLNVDGVTIQGEGMEKSVLTFAGQVQGAEGLLVNASDFTIRDLAIEDTRGDALKINEGRNIVIQRVRTEWTTGPDEGNGAYGIYPVQTENVLLEDSVAIGASDAGIYVGQSRNVVVRNNRAEYNVAGIEIENTIGADVYGNLATNNTGGILVFNMPDLPQEGHSTRVFDNRVHANNTDNFGAAGTPVSSVPAGSGIVVNANDKVEIFANEISDNNTANIIISSYYSTGFDSSIPVAEHYDPYPEAIYIHDNVFSGGGESPDGLELKALKLAAMGLGEALPDILWDGYTNPQKVGADGALLPEYAICVPDETVIVLNADLANGSENVSTDSGKYRCTLPELAAIRIPQVAAD